MLTLTAPGDGLHAMPSGDICPCTDADGVDLAVWNGHVGPRWNRFCQALRRLLGVPVQYFRAVEVQSRGALHEHVLLRAPAGSWRLSRRQIAAIRRLAIAHGYGHEVDLVRVQAGERAAGYVAKYAAKSTDQRSDVPWLYRDTGELGRGRAWQDGAYVTRDGTVEPRGKVRRPGYRVWTASRRWGLTMAGCRAVQRAWAVQHSGAKRPLDLNAEGYTQGGPTASDPPRGGAPGGGDAAR